MKEMTIRRKVLRKRGTDKLYGWNWRNESWSLKYSPELLFTDMTIEGLQKIIGAPDDAELIEVDVKIILP